MILLEGAAIFFAGILIGRFLPLRRHTRKTRDPVCGCGHHRSFHDPETGQCAGRVYIKGSTFSEGVAQYEQCTCRQYSGPVPLPVHYAPEISGDA